MNIKFTQKPGCHKALNEWAKTLTFPTSNYPKGPTCFKNRHFIVRKVVTHEGWRIPKQTNKVSVTLEKTTIQRVTMALCELEVAMVEWGWQAGFCGGEFVSQNEMTHWDTLCGPVHISTEEARFWSTYASLPNMTNCDSKHMYCLLFKFWDKCYIQNKNHILVKYFFKYTLYTDIASV